MALATVGGVSALGLLGWLPGHLRGEHQLGPQLQPGEVTWLLVGVVLLAQAGLVLVIAKAPSAALLLLTGLPLVLLLAPAPPLGLFTLTAISEMTGVFAAAAVWPLRALNPALVGSALFLTAGQCVNGLRGGPSLTPAAIGAAVGQAIVVMGLPLLVGSLVAARRAVEASYRRQLIALQGEQEARLAAAIARQRIAMSCELHDIAAHHLSGIALLAAAIGQQIDTDPAAAKRSASQVREQNRLVLADLRRLVGLLREDADGARPVETIDALTALVQQRREAGTEIDLIVSPSVGRRAEDIGPLGQLVVHRMVQESLSNAATHAPGAPCTIEVDAEEGPDLVVTVRNAAADPSGREPVASESSSGFGLVGMTERAQLVGGALCYGPSEASGWYVRLTVPFDDPPAAPGSDRDVGAATTKALA